MKITKILPGKFKKDFCSIFIDDLYSFKLHQDVITKRKIKAGTELSPEELEDIKQAGEQKESLEYAYLFLSYKARTEKEMTERLKRKGFSQNAVQSAIGFLKSKNLINDSALAKDFAESRLKSTRMWGSERVEQDLIRKGVDASSIQRIMQDLQEENDASIPNEEERAYQALLKRQKQIKAIDPRTLQRRLYDHLVRRGFSIDTAERALHRFKREGHLKVEEE